MEHKLYFLYKKWIKGYCRHFCKLCEYRYRFSDDCMVELYYDIMDERDKKKAGYEEQKWYKQVWLFVKGKFRK